MDAFRFSPELIADRGAVLERLEVEGIEWFSHFTSIDPIHEEFGLEVCGIRRRRDARTIRRLVMDLYPDWELSETVYVDWGPDCGWMVRVHRDPITEPDSEPW